MKRFLLIPLALTLASYATISLGGQVNTGPKIFSHKKEERIAKRMETLRAILLDHENFCTKGCRYKISHVKTVKILSTAETSQGTESFLWDFVDGWKKVKTYRRSLVPLVLEAGVWRLQSSLPDKQTVERLDQLYGLGESSLFSVMNTNWELKEAVDENGQWIGTDIAYSVYGESDDSTIRMFPGQVLAGMKETANQMFGHLRDAAENEVD